MEESAQKTEFAHIKLRILEKGPFQIPSVLVHLTRLESMLS